MGMTLKNSRQEILIAGTKKGVCPLCNETKTLLVLRYGIIICKSCLHVLTQILEYTEHGVSEEELRHHFNVQEIEE
ncbi:MAG: hypothetical protein D4S01_09100 [Dehalococcoidia bacterium]|nr:MAG: hypothetical protein D4S01_09100 [Dehalococcoidia bacterium]